MKTKYEIATYSCCDFLSSKQKNYCFLKIFCFITKNTTAATANAKDWILAVVSF
jgi:hypothetical protein